MQFSTDHLVVCGVALLKFSKLNNIANFLTSKMDVEEQSGDGDALLECFSPLFCTMRVFGLYFKQASRRIHDASSVTPDSAVPKKWNRGRIYAVIIMVILWLNVAKMLSVFEKTDKLGYNFFLKLAMVSSGFFIAVLHTACFIACQTGNLDRVFLDARLPKSDHIKYRRLAVIHSIVLLALLVVDVLVFLVPMFTTENELLFSLAPFGVHVFISDQLLIIPKLMLTLLFILSDFTWFFSYSVNYMAPNRFVFVTNVNTVNSLWSFF